MKILLKTLILFMFTMTAMVGNSEPIVILEYRGSAATEISNELSDNAFIVDPDHFARHVVEPGQSLGQIINEFYSGSGLDKRFLKLAIVAANPKAFAQENPNFMFAGAKLLLPSLNQIQALLFGKRISENPEKIESYNRPSSGIFFFGG